MPPETGFGPTEYRDEELLACVILRLITGLRHVAVGAQSPIPALAALTARHQGAGRPLVSLLSSARHTFFTDGGRELFDLGGQGRVDAFFLSGGQIDGAGNINLVGIGDYERPTVRFPGSFGSAYLYFVVPNVILFRTEHSRRSLVEAVDFISAPGTSPAGVYRPGGPVALVTNRCVFAFDRSAGGFRLESLHRGHTMEEVLDHTGFTFERGETAPETTPPCAELLTLMRETIAPELAEVYPTFAAEVFGARAASGAPGVR